MNKFISSKHLEGVSDLTLSAPIKQGFVDAFEAVTYETRLRTVMKALFKVRATAREHSMIKPFVDTAERIQSLLDFRLAIHGSELLLSATFDKPFEPYMRLIWNPLGPLLDVIFCNCEGYVTATEHSFEDYLAWVRKSQIDTNFFYAASGLSTDDIQYLAKIEKLQREAARPFSAATETVESPIEIADRVRREVRNRKESNQLGMEALVALYKLADLYPPDRPDGRYLLWATQQLLQGWGKKDLDSEGWTALVDEQLAWLEREGPPTQRADGERLIFANSDIQGGIVKNYGGRKNPVLHGALLLMRIADPVKARAFIKDLSRVPEPAVTPSGPPKATGPAGGLRIQAETPGPDKPEGNTFLNLAFTRHGLVNIGLSEAEFECFPQEFREGMEERAGLLGDVRDNHPRRWSLPARHLRPGAKAEPPVEMSEIDIVLQLRTTEDRNAAVPPGKGGQEIDRWVKALCGEPQASGLELLSVEVMRRAPLRGDVRTPEHFGFSDGISQPRPVDGIVSPDRDEVPRGDIFLGYSNGRTDSPPPANALLDNGTFLVIRKLEQKVHALDAFVDRNTDGINEQIEQINVARQAKGKPSLCLITKEDLYAKLIGRRRNGTALAAPEQSRKFNKFSYEEDQEGEKCPLWAHVRRTNPRTALSETNGRPTPRILRRGLSYGPGFESKRQKNGVFFMAYNASLAEQFEVIQRWLTGGNSTGIGSWQSDPLMGVGQRGDCRAYQLVHEGETFRLDVPKPFVKLQWGAYLFVPSMSALRTIAALAPDEHGQRQAQEMGQAVRGERIVARLRALGSDGPEGRIAAGAAWKTCLEDFASKDPAEKDEAGAVWAAIRLYHGGALRVPYGIVPPRESPPDAVLVASKDMVMRVFRDTEGNYSMCGQMARMKQSFGEIFLGMDKGPVYDAKSRINDRLFAIPEKEAFELARGAALRSLAMAFDITDALQFPKCKIDLRRHFITPALAIVCNHMFGIPDSLQFYPPPTGNSVDPYGWSWEPAEARKPRCPGDFMATSRFCFYPDPIPRVKAYGKSQGQALRKAVRAHFDTVRGTPALAGTLSQAMATLALEDGTPVYPDNDELARTVIGVMTGFLPPADGCMRWALYDWLEDKTLWRVQHELRSAEVAPADLAAADAAAAAASESAAGDPAAEAAIAAGREMELAYARADKALRPRLERAMQKRPAPDLLWRTATRNHRLGDVDIAADDKVVIGIVSAVAEDAAAGIADVYPIFGGQRGRPDSPLHACPAYKAAMGTMLGIISALLDNVKIDALPAPLLVTLSDPGPALAPLRAAQTTAASAAASASDAASHPAAPASGAQVDAAGTGGPAATGDWITQMLRPDADGPAPAAPGGDVSDPADHLAPSPVK